MDTTSCGVFTCLVRLFCFTFPLFKSRAFLALEKVCWKSVPYSSLPAVWSIHSIRPHNIWLSQREWTFLKTFQQDNHTLLHPLLLPVTWLIVVFFPLLRPTWTASACGWLPNWFNHSVHNEQHNVRFMVFIPTLLGWFCLYLKNPRVTLFVFKVLKMIPTELPPELLNEFHECLLVFSLCRCRQFDGKYLLYNYVYIYPSRAWCSPKIQLLSSSYSCLGVQPFTFCVFKEEKKLDLPLKSLSWIFQIVCHKH